MSLSFISATQGQHLCVITNNDVTTACDRRRYFTHQCVLMFLKGRESRIESFTRNFLRLVASDDKVKLIRDFLSEVFGQLMIDPMWEGEIASHVFVVVMMSRACGVAATTCLAFKVTTK